MKTASQILAIVSLGTFFGALVAPALQYFEFGSTVDWAGWQACLASFGMLQGIRQQPMLLVLPGAAIGNVVFLAAPLVLLRGAPGARSLRTFAAMVFIALLLAAYAPYAGFPPAKLLCGYYLWLSAFVVLLGGIATRMGIRRHVARHA